MLNTLPMSGSRMESRFSRTEFSFLIDKTFNINNIWVNANQE